MSHAQLSQAECSLIVVLGQMVKSRRRLARMLGTTTPTLDIVMVRGRVRMATVRRVRRNLLRHLGASGADVTGVHVHGTVQ